MERTGTITAVSGDTLEVTFCRPGDCEKMPRLHRR